MCPSSWWTVTRSSSSILMHIFRRTSSTVSMSQALAWQTTSRSRGFWKSDRTQKERGRLGKPIEVKKPTPSWTIFSGVKPICTIAAVTSICAASGYGSTSG